MIGDKYIKKEIEKIIERGSVSKKATLFLRDRMGYFGSGFILTYEEIERLTLSVKPEKRKEWESYISFGLRLENGFKDLDRFLRELTGYRETLLRTLTEIRDFEILEECLNKLVNKDSDEFRQGLFDFSVPEDAKENIETNRVETGGLSLVRMTLDKWNNISLNLTGEGSLTERAEKNRDDLREQMRSYLCYEEAMIGRIKESKIEVPEYGDKLRKNRSVLEKPVSMRVRFQGRQDNRTYQTSLVRPEEGPLELPYPALRDLVENYSVYPEEINLNEEKNIKLINEYYNQI